MKKLIFLLIATCTYVCAQAQTNTRLKDGLYLVERVVYDSTQADQHPDGKARVSFNKLFLENAPEGARSLVLYTANFVPLELDKAPELLKDADAKKSVQLSFSRLAAEQLSAFTQANLMKQVTIVVNGEALTLHKIRAAITGGKMQITRCSDNACELIYVELKNNVK